MTRQARQTAAFLKRLRSLDGAKDDREKLRDFLELAYCAIAKLTAAPERAEALEDRYMTVVRSYRDKDDVRAYPELLAMAVCAVPEHGDFLGPIAAELGALNPRVGQFFTPWEVARLMAEMMLADTGAIIAERGFITLSEPAAGAGGMVLAAAETLRQQGHDPARTMLAHAAEISPLCFQMCFLQLAFAGLPALVERMDTLSLERFEAAWTPATAAFYTEHGQLFPEGQGPETHAPELPKTTPGAQLDLFGKAQS